jgi:nucleotide-binding universal stress UspA family protein
LRDLVHQLGVPLAAIAVLAAPAALFAHELLVIPVLGTASLLAIAASDFVRIAVPPSARGSGFRFRLELTALNLLQPVARAWGRARNRALARRTAFPVPAIAGPIQHLGRGVFLMPEKRPRPELAENIVQRLRRAGMRVVPPTGWEPYDALVMSSALVGAELVTSAHPPGWVQLRVRRYLRWKPALLVCGAAGLASLTDVRVALGLALLAAANIAVGAWRTGPGLHRVLTSGGGER